jgi:RNA polymerase-binding transcription factor DksA
MNEQQSKTIEARLLRERERITESLGRVDEAAVISTDEDGDLTRYPLHPADQGTDTIGAETAMALLSQESDRLNLVDDALLRLASDPGNYDKCTSCGKVIPFERLDLVPWTRMCTECQAAAEGTAA